MKAKQVISLLKQSNELYTHNPLKLNNFGDTSEIKLICLFLHFGVRIFKYSVQIADSHYISRAKLLKKYTIFDFL